MIDASYDLLIINALVVALTDGDKPEPDHYVKIIGDRISDIGRMENLPADVKAGRIIDAEQKLVMPGLINAHVHCPMTLFRGLADDLPLMTWLHEHIFPAEAEHVNEELVYWGTRLACAEMLLSGATGLADGYFLETHAARAVKESGMRALVGQGVVDFPAPGVLDPSRNIDHVKEFIDEWLGDPLVTPSVFCHSPYTCSAKTLRKAKELAREKNVTLQIHVSETAAEVDQIRREHGKLPVEYLDSLGILDESTLAVHCVHLDDSEIDILAERNTPVATCVESNMKLASGLASVPRMLDKGVTVALGTDGPASNNDLNMFGEMHTLALIYKASGHDPTILPAPKVLELAGPMGARALGWKDVGRLRPGAKADLVIMELKGPHLTPLYHPRSHLVYAATGREVNTVLIDGKIVVENREIKTFDLAETMHRVREISKKIKTDC